MLRSATDVALPFALDALMDGHRGKLAILNRHHRRSRVLRADAVAAREYTRNVCLEFRIHLDEAFLCCESQLGGQARLFLTHGLDHLIRANRKVRTFDGTRRTPARNIRWP